jgi:hypothetical protein
MATSFGPAVGTGSYLFIQELGKEIPNKMPNAKLQSSNQFQNPNYKFDI